MAGTNSPKQTAAQLRAIYERNPCPEVRELLWEIHRLRLLLLRANQLQHAMSGGCANSTQLILEIFQRELAGEPCVAEREAWEREFFGPPRVSEYTRRRKTVPTLVLDK
ncbi:hypothetical protein AU476_07600 [Cupriavidus sp. UYMSc13B]|nr:hypothetical protein AU476_07600 [Cupriavidus sp. UYMSc13B]